ncbi:hypothetical protein M378DRAFT_16729, partial [Amanita muscaria Koide BX008]
GDNPLSDEPFLGPEYVPGNPEEELPTHLRTQSTVVVGPVNQGTIFSANTESSDEEGTSGTDNALEYISAEGNQSEEETHLETVVPPTPINLELLQIKPPVAPTATTETPDVEMSQAPLTTTKEEEEERSSLFPKTLLELEVNALDSSHPSELTSASTKTNSPPMPRKSPSPSYPVSHGTWNEFRTRFINQWEEVSAMASAMIKIQKLELGKKYNMTQLISRFNELIPYCKIQDNEPMKIHFFTQCFPDNIKTHIFLKNPATYDDARKYATEFGLAYDRIDADNGKQPRYGTAGNDNYNRQQRDPNTMDVDAINFEEGTNIRFTKLSPSQVEDYKKQGKCFNCGQKGHMSRMCPTKKKGNGG